MTLSIGMTGQKKEEGVGGVEGISEVDIERRLGPHVANGRWKRGEASCTKTAVLRTSSRCPQFNLGSRLGLEGRDPSMAEDCTPITEDTEHCLLSSLLTAHFHRSKLPLGGEEGGTDNKSPMMSMAAIPPLFPTTFGSASPPPFSVAAVGHL